MKNDSSQNDNSNKSAADIAADLFIYMPVGVAVEVGKHLPNLAKQGRDLVEGPLNSLKSFGEVAVKQGRRDLEQRFRKATTVEETASTSRTTPPAGAIKNDTHLAIDGYSSMSVVEILDHLTRLDAAQIEQVRDYEVGHLNRTAILARCEELLRTSGN